LILALSFSVLSASAQENGFNPSDPGCAERYAKFDFQGKFAALVFSDKVNNYYLVNFSLLPTRFEKIWFMNMAFKNGKVVNIDPNVSRSQVWFQSNLKYPSDEILLLFGQLRTRTGEAAVDLNGQQQEKWLRENDKYK
jgi:hypothetical protein